MGMLDKALAYNPWVHFYEFEVYKRPNNYNAEVLMQIFNSQKDVFKLVRNPYRRAISSFTVLIGGMKQYYAREAKEIKKLFYHDENSDKGISFKQFLYYLKETGTHIGAVDYHFAQQYIEGEENLVKNYIRLENFNHHILAFEKEYQLLPSPLPLITKSEHHLSSFMILTGDHSETLFTEINGALPAYQSFYDEETKDLVKELFKKDFEMYQYKNTDLS
jgi:hypothetical protein